MNHVCVAAFFLFATIGCGAKTTTATTQADQADAASSIANPSEPDCTPPMTLVKGRAVWGDNLAVDATRVYWTEFAGPPEAPHSVWAAPKQGGEPALVWRGATGLFGAGMAIAGQTIFWSGEGGPNLPANGVFSVRTDGTSFAAMGAFDSTCAAYGGVAVDADNVYAATITCGVGIGQLVAISRSGGNRRVLWSSDTKTVWWIAAAAGKVYAAGPDLLAVPANGDAPTTLVNGPVSGVAVNDTHMFTCRRGTLVAVPLEGGPAAPLGPCSDRSVIVADKRFVFVTEPPKGGTPDGASAGGMVVDLAKIPVAGGAPTTLASGVTIDTLALDDRALFWSTLGADAGGGSFDVPAIGRVGTCEE
jgi:hypothetical protein